jgi:hypothetical protein
MPQWYCKSIYHIAQKSKIILIYFLKYDEGDGLQIWKIAPNILDKQLWTADKGMILQFGGWAWC